MKKIYAVAICAIISLLLCSCGKTVSSEQKTDAITYADIYEVNTYTAITSNHTSILLKDSELTDGEYAEADYYWSKSGYASTTYPYTDNDGNSVRDLSFLTDDGSYLYLSPMTAERATYDILQYYVESGAPTVESVSMFGLAEPKYNQIITEYKKTDSGSEVTGENSSKELVITFCSAFFPDREYTDGDKILFKLELNENNETLKYENYYVFADGSEPVQTNYGEFIYDDACCPDYIKSVNSVLEKGAKDISVKVYLENEVIERKVYSDVLLLYTDYEVYLDSDYTDLLSDDYGYYEFETDEDITVYLKTPAAE